MSAARLPKWILHFCGYRFCFLLAFHSSIQHQRMWMALTRFDQPDCVCHTRGHFDVCVCVLGSVSRYSHVVLNTLSNLLVHFAYTSIHPCCCTLQYANAYGAAERGALISRLPGSALLCKLFVSLLELNPRTALRQRSMIGFTLIHPWNHYFPLVLSVLCLSLRSFYSQYRVPVNNSGCPPAVLTSDAVTSAGTLLLFSLHLSYTAVLLLFVAFL